MQKTTIRLPKKLLVTTKKQALEEGLSLQELIAQSIRLRLDHKDLMIKANEPNQGRQHATDLMKLAKKLTEANTTGPSDLASNIDPYLYGNK